MLPNLHDGDFLLAVRHEPIQRIRKGQIVVWKSQSNHPATGKLPRELAQAYFIKRIVGLPDDEVMLNRTVNIPSESGAPTLVQVPPGHCFVEGDSPGYDSHVIGPIPLDWIKGIVVFRIKQQNISFKSPRQNF